MRKINGETWENALKNTIPKRKLEGNSDEEEDKTKNPNKEEEKKE